MHGLTSDELLQDDAGGTVEQLGPLAGAVDDTLEADLVANGGAQQAVGFLCDAAGVGDGRDFAWLCDENIVRFVVGDAVLNDELRDLRRLRKKKSKES